MNEEHARVSRRAPAGGQSVRVRALLDPATTARPPAQGEGAALTMLARLLVPSLADWCIIYLRGEEGHTERVVQVAADEALDRQLREYTARYPLERLPHHPVLQAMATGETLLLPEIDETWPDDLGADPPHAADIAALQMSSAIVVPLVSGPRVLGAVKVCRTRQSQRRLTHDDIPVFEQIAQLAAYALENARLREEAELARAEAEAALRAQEEADALLVRERSRLKVLLDHLPVGVALTDAAGRFEYLNAQLAELWGVDADDPPSLQDAPRRAYFEDGTEVREGEWPIQRALREGRATEDTRLRVVDANGDTRWVDARARPVLEGDAVIGALVAVTDVTHRRRLEEVLLTEREVHEALLTVVGELGQGVVAAEGARFVYVNDAFARLAGYSVEELTSPDFDVGVLWTPDEAPIMQRALEHAEADGTSRSGEMSLVRRDGSRLRLSAASRIMNVGGRVLQLGVVRDVTVQRQAEAALARAHEALEQNRRLGAMATLVSGVGHEIRTPLTYISNHLYLARHMLARAAERGLDPEGVQALDAHLKTATEGADRVNALVADLRRFVRLDPTRIETAPLDEVVGEALDLFRATHPAATRVEARLGPSPSVPLVRAQVHQLVLNLLENAAEATADCPGDRASIRIETGEAPAGGGAMVRVEDDGPGIPEDVRQRMFEPLFTTKPNATGLGLAIVRRIVEDHHGSIACDADPGAGARFHVTFPPDP